MEKRANELQVYSGIAILFVVILHSNAYYLMNVLKQNSYLSAGIFIYLVDKIVHAAVPMFIFISGYKYAMNNRKDQYKEFFLKKFRTVFKPFFLISTFYLLYHWVNVFARRYMIYKVFDVEYVLYNGIRDFFRMFLGYNFAYQLWYIPMYLFIILSYPVIAKRIRNDRIRLVFFVLLAVMWEIVSSLNISFLANKPYPLMFIYYYFLFEMGCMLYTSKLQNKNFKIVTVIYFTLLLSTVIVKNTLLVRTLSDLALYPVASVFFLHMSTRLKDSRILMILGNYSFYIYLFHEPLILSTTARYLLNHGMYRWGILSPILAVYTLAVSLVLSKILLEYGFGRYNIKSKSSIQIKGA